MTRRQRRRQRLWCGFGFVVLAVLLLCAPSAWAQAMPWEQPLNTIATSVTGPVAGAALLIAVVIFGICWIAGYSIIGMALGLVVGGAIVANAPDIVTLFGG